MGFGPDAEVGRKPLQVHITLDSERRLPLVFCIAPGLALSLLSVRRLFALPPYIAQSSIAIPRLKLSTLAR